MLDKCGKGAVTACVLIYETVFGVLKELVLLVEIPESGWSGWATNSGAGCSLQNALLWWENDCKSERK